MMDLTTLALFFSIALGTIYIVFARFAVGVAPGEPPLISSRLPFLGHAIGLLYYGQSYWVKVDARNRLPIFTVQLLSRKAYIVTSLELVNAIQRNHRTLDFAPFVAKVAEKLSGLPPDRMKLFEQHDGRPGLSKETITGITASLKQSHNDELTTRFLKDLKLLIDFATSDPNRPCKLHASLRHVITQATCAAFYGPRNPINTQEIEDAFWYFEENGSILMTDFLPALKRGRTLRARSIVADALTRYYKDRGYEEASVMTKTRFESGVKYGLSEEEIALIEVPFMFALFNNVVPVAFWTLSEILSKPDTLLALRMELTSAVENSFPSSVLSKHTVDIGLLKRTCPTLLAVYHEALRKRASFSSARFVTADTRISDGANTYILKAGSLVQVPTDVIHSSPTHWGPDAGATDHTRFLDPPRKKTHPLSFRSFGGAPFICPGRQIATTEILAVVAMLVMRYDVAPVDDTYITPVQNLSMFASVPPPKSDVEVFFRPRKGWEGDWDFKLGEKGLSWVLESG